MHWCFCVPCSFTPHTSMTTKIGIAMSNIESCKQYVLTEIVITENIALQLHHRLISTLTSSGNPQVGYPDIFSRYCTHFLINSSHITFYLV